MIEDICHRNERLTDVLFISGNEGKVHKAVAVVLNCERLNLEGRGHGDGLARGRNKSDESPQVIGQFKDNH